MKSTPGIRVPLLAACAGFLLAGCASTGHRACGDGEQAAVSELLYFGTGIPSGGTVTASEWADFLGSSVTPRFPEGLTVWSAAGQWQSADGRITSESSYVLSLLHAPTADAEARVEAVLSEYKSRFRQEAVLRVRVPACMSL